MNTESLTVILSFFAGGMAGTIIMLMLMLMKTLISLDKFRKDNAIGDQATFKILTDLIYALRDDNRQVTAALIVEANQPVNEEAEAKEHARHYANNREKVVQAFITPSPKDVG